jgi:hypothetical protein
VPGGEVTPRKRVARQKRGHRPHGRGTPELDRVFDGVGRIRRASGTTDAETYRAIDAMLTTLYAQGRLDVLEGIRDGKLRPLLVWAAFRQGRVDRLPTGETMAPLGSEAQRPRVGVWAWLDGYECSEHHRVAMKSGWRQLLKHSPKPAPMVADLPVVLRAYKAACRGETPTMFNRVKSYVQSYLSDTLGASHPLYTQVADVKNLTVTGKRKPKPQTVEQMRKLAELVAPEVWEAAWAMAVTGMGPKEYWQQERNAWTVLADRIHIRGTKTEHTSNSRDRDIPLVYRIPLPRITRTKFEDALAEGTKGHVQPYDFRRTFANWMTYAAIPANRRKHYRGHSAVTMDDLYERAEVLHYLAADAEALRGYIGAWPKAGLAVVQGGKR